MCDEEFDNDMRKLQGHVDNAFSAVYVGCVAVAVVSLTLTCLGVYGVYRIGQSQGWW